MAGIRKMLEQMLNGFSPEEAIRQFKEKLHNALNHFKDDPQSRLQLKQYLRSVYRPLQYFNASVVRPQLANPERLKSTARQYGLNKIELKRIYKTALELELRIQKFYEDENEVDRLIVMLRKVINTFDEQMLSDILDAVDYHVDYGKIERAYLDYQSSMEKAFNAAALNREIKNILNVFGNNFKDALQGKSRQRRPARASDGQSEVKMMDPALQSFYDRYRSEGFSHDEAMKYVNEKSDLDSLSVEQLEAYRSLRRKSGKNHAEAMKQLGVAEEKE